MVVEEFIIVVCWFNSFTLGVGLVEKRGDGTRNAGDGRRLRCRIFVTFRFFGIKYCLYRIVGVGFSVFYFNVGGARLRGYGERRFFGGFVVY